MKNRTILEISFGVAICLVSYFTGYVVGGNSATNNLNKATTVQSNKEYKQVQKKDNSQTKKDNGKIYKFGEEGQSGAWAIKVLDTQEATTIQSGDGSDNKTTTQKFIVIHLQMTDKESGSAQYSPDDFLLGNYKTKAQYKMNMEAGSTANEAKSIYAQDGNFFGVYDSINPNLPKQTYVVFEVPKDFNIADGVLMHKGDDNKLIGYYLK